MFAWYTAFSVRILNSADWVLVGHKWTSMMLKRTYFGNWLRDYSQAVDVGTLKGVQADTIRVLVWVLAFMSFGYATAEFEVTAERLGVYRPEE
jgi:branched-subunit amino acid ABC-type transport system permease component